jgi:hypothetical protein
MSLGKISSRFIAVQRSIPHAVLSSKSWPSFRARLRLICLLRHKFGSHSHSAPHSVFFLIHSQVDFSTSYYSIIKVFSNSTIKVSSVSVGIEQHYPVHFDFFSVLIFAKISASFAAIRSAHSCSNMLKP